MFPVIKRAISHWFDVIGQVEGEALSDETANKKRS